jgi:hypothetical protein
MKNAVTRWNLDGTRYEYFGMAEKTEETKKKVFLT